MKNLIVRAAIAVALVTTLFALGCASEQKPKSAVAEIAQVESMTVAEVQLPSYYEAVGTVKALQSAQVSAQTVGNVVRVNAREGDFVRRGAVLATIDDSQTRAGLDRALASQQSAAQDVVAAKADFSLAESTLKRYEVLRERKSVSPHEFDEVQSRYEAAKARRDMTQAAVAGAEAAIVQARTAQGYTQVRAPFDGLVTAKQVEPGNLAAPGTPLFTVEDTSSFRLEVTVDEGNIGLVKPGAPVPVYIDAIAGEPLKAQVVQILPSADPNSRSFLIKLQLPKQSGVRTGLFGRARFLSGVRQGYSVPEKAIVRRGAMQAVYTVGADQVTSLRYITVGRQMPGAVEILSGIESGDRIITNPGDRELNGRRVEVR